MGNPSLGNFGIMIRSGKNSPVLKSDLERAYEISGNIAALKGKTKHYAAKFIPAEYTAIPKHIRSKVQLYVDLMFVDVHVWFIAVVGSTNYTYGVYLGEKKIKGTKSAGNLLMAAEKVIDSVKQDHLEVGEIVIDGESGIQAVRTKLNAKGVELSAAPGINVGPAERCIQTIGTKYRSRWSTLMFTMCNILQVGLIIWCIRCINFTPSKRMADMIPPVTAQKGRVVDIGRDFAIGFGEFCQTTAPKTVKSSSPEVSRTEDAISLYPMDNAHGSVKFLNLTSMKMISREAYKEVPMPTTVVAYINSIALKEGKTPKVSPILGIGNRILSDEVSSDEYDDEGVHNADEYVRPNFVPSEEVAEDEEPVESEVEIREADDHVPLVPEHEYESNPGYDSDHSEIVGTDSIVDEENRSESSSEDDPNEVTDDFSEPEGIGQEETGTSSPRVHWGTDSVPTVDPGVQLPDMGLGSPAQDPWKGGIRSSPVKHPRREGLRQHSKFYYQSGRDSRVKHYGLHISVNKALKTMRKPALKSIVKELSQVFDVKSTFHPVKLNSLTTKQLKGIIRSHMFLKEKYRSEAGKQVFEKLKARLVAGGHLQDKSLYEDLSSPTAHLQSVFTVAALAAMEGRVVVTCDIGSAYLNAPMDPSHEPVFMRIDAELAKVLVAMYPDKFKDYLNYDGSVVVQLDKALYGCVQSAKLWYEHLRGTLEAIGYTRNPHDICVFNKDGEDGKQCTVTIHVDDLLITCVTQATIEELLNHLVKTYTTVEIRRGCVHEYLGVVYDFTDKGSVSISMEAYTREVLQCYNVRGKAATPALEHLFEVREESTKLSEAGREEFHSAVAKLLYLAKRSRPDILPAIIFLTSRVTKADVDDQAKLERVMKYLNVNPELCIKLKVGRTLSVIGFVDAAYGVHHDYRSHTGAMISLGTGPVFVKSSKQKINSKSSTEAELVGLSDSASQVIWTRDFLAAQGYELQSAEIFQDNKSTISMIEKGRSTSEKSRHINIRFFFLKDRISAKEIKITYLPTEMMVADILTKPLQGRLFLELRKKLMGH